MRHKSRPTEEQRIWMDKNWSGGKLQPTPLWQNPCPVCDRTDYIDVSAHFDLAYDVKVQIMIECMCCGYLRGIVPILKPLKGHGVWNAYGVEKVANCWIRGHYRGVMNDGVSYYRFYSSQDLVDSIRIISIARLALEGIPLGLLKSVRLGREPVHLLATEMEEIRHPRAAAICGMAKKQQLIRAERPKRYQEALSKLEETGRPYVVGTTSDLLTKDRLLRRSVTTQIVNFPKTILIPRP